MISKEDQAALERALTDLSSNIIRPYADEPSPREVIVALVTKYATLAQGLYEQSAETVGKLNQRNRDCQRLESRISELTHYAEARRKEIDELDRKVAQVKASKALALDRILAFQDVLLKF